MAKLTREQTKLASDIKRANQRLREMEKQGLEGWSKAYEDVKGLYEYENINPTHRSTGTTSKGQMKFRTDVARLSKDKGLFDFMKDLIKNFLSAVESSTKEVRKRKRKIEEVQKNFENKYGDMFSGEKGRERINRVIDDERLFNDLRARFGSEPAAIIMDDIAAGIMSRDKVEDYLDNVEYKRGETVADLYAYASTTEDWTRGDW